MLISLKPLSCKHLTAQMQHPFRQTLVSLEMDLSDVRNLTCQVLGGNRDNSVLTPQLSAILQRTQSIPVTVRSLILYWEKEDLSRLNKELVELDRFIADNRFLDAAPAPSHDVMDVVDGGQSVPMSTNAVNSVDSCDSEGKVLKKRRTDDVDVSKRSESGGKDDKKDSSSRSVPKEGVFAQLLCI